MENKKIVVALGNTALGKSFPEQKAAVKKAASAIADLAEKKYQIVITHGNGPQVGMIHKAMTEFGHLHSDYTVAPMSICSAMSQGYIGYDLQNAIRTELLNRGIFKPVSTIITQVQVDTFDKAFSNPTKKIGRYMTEEEAAEEKKKGHHVVYEEGKGYRRIISAPRPIKIYEIDAIKALSDAGQIVIACGGGGIPVLEQGTVLKGASAVIEKDYTSMKLADLLDAGTLLFLTGVEKASLYFQQEKEEKLSNVTFEQAQGYLADGHFSPNNMYPKVDAAATFAASGNGRESIITSLDKALDSLKGRTGTHFTA
jgi:carbamate kinase